MDRPIRLSHPIPFAVLQGRGFLVLKVCEEVAHVVGHRPPREPERKERGKLDVRPHLGSPLGEVMCGLQHPLGCDRGLVDDVNRRHAAIIIRAATECGIRGIALRPVRRGTIRRMTMVSFRVADGEAEELRRWAEALGVDRSEFLREALHRQLVRLRSEVDASTAARIPATEAELALAAVADWGPAEDWKDWQDAPG